jgi:DNA topoisomerase-1
MEFALAMTAKTGCPAAHASNNRELQRRDDFARRLGMHIVSAESLSIRRRKSGDSFAFYSARGRKITDARTLRRLKSLAVPPAYTDVSLAEDPRAHLQAIGRDAAGRLQYRYHPDWTAIREAHKAEHLAQLLETLPRIRRGLTRHLASRTPTRELALAAVIELVAQSSIRAGREIYARTHGTRGAATLLKSDVTLRGGSLVLDFTAKGGKETQKQIASPRLAAAVRLLQKLPGPRLFQYRDAEGDVRTVRARDVNDFLLTLSGVAVTLKDFRTLCACVTTLDAILSVPLASNSRQRGKQLREAVKVASAELGNTPTMCRKSYVRVVVDALENQRAVTKLSAARNGSRRPKPEKILSDLLPTPAETLASASSRASPQVELRS